MSQTHHIHRLLLGGGLFLAPVKEPRRILDLGTGTGIWAVEVADEHPEAEVIGNDLSPIQPTWTPPNCRFEIDDSEQQPWEYSRPFDYIHGRDLEGCVRDYDQLFSEARNNLVPGGYFEIAGIDIIVTSDDGTHEKATNFIYLCDFLYECSKDTGKSLRNAKTWKDRMLRAGFENVEEHVYKLPHSPWPKDPKLREIGRYHQVNMFEGIASYSYAYFSRVLGWSRGKTELLLAGVRKELKDLSIHSRTDVYIVYGRRPQE